MVLVEASSEPEVPIYERFRAGPWIDDTGRIDIHATVRDCTRPATSAIRR
jgi:hypothetical protein